MEVAIVQSEDKADLKLLAELARKMGIRFKVLTEEQKADIGMGLLMKEADRSQKVSEEEIMRKLNG
jgi:hypothetical protein